jgi:hypothetical protein
LLDGAAQAAIAELAPPAAGQSQATLRGHRDRGMCSGFSRRALRARGGGRLAEPPRSRSAPGSTALIRSRHAEPDRCAASETDPPP